MPYAPDAFREVVADIQQWLNGSSLPGEAVVRQAIVLRLLQAAGFNIWNPAEVVPEETSKTGSRADFLIRTDGGKFALELKGMNISLSPKDYEQVATYAANESTRWAILTNGLVWSVMDTTYNPASPFHEREVLKVEWDNDNLGQVADDLFCLFSRVTWEKDNFDSSVKLIQGLQRKRKNIANVITEKMPEVVKFQEDSTIVDFEKAVTLFAQLGKITEEERDILLSHQYKDNGSIESGQSGAILLRLKYRKLNARALYNPITETWTVLKGSELSQTVKPYAGKSVLQRRAKLSEEGKLSQTDAGLVLLCDDIYDNPSAAAAVLAGDSMSGWDSWFDANGNSAQLYRKEPKQKKE